MSPFNVTTQTEEQPENNERKSGVKEVGREKSLPKKGERRCFQCHFLRNFPFYFCEGSGCLLFSVLSTVRQSRRQVELSREKSVMSTVVVGRSICVDSSMLSVDAQKVRR